MSRSTTCSASAFVVAQARTGARIPRVIGWFSPATRPRTPRACTPGFVTRWASCCARRWMPDARRCRRARQAHPGSTARLCGALITSRWKASGGWAGERLWTRRRAVIRAGRWWRAERASCGTLRSQLSTSRSTAASACSPSQKRSQERFRSGCCATICRLLESMQRPRSSAWTRRLMDRRSPSLSGGGTR